MIENRNRIGKEWEIRIIEKNEKKKGIWIGNRKKKRTANGEEIKKKKK